MCAFPLPFFYVARRDLPNVRNFFLLRVRVPLVALVAEVGTSHLCCTLITDELPFSPCRQVLCGTCLWSPAKPGPAARQGPVLHKRFAERVSGLRASSKSVSQRQPGPLGDSRPAFRYVFYVRWF